MERQKLYAVIIIRKDGQDGQSLDMDVGEIYVFGSDVKCQVRLKAEFVPNVAPKHAQISVDKDGKATIQNLTEDTNSVKLRSGSTEVFVTTAPLSLSHGDVISICTRAFRFEEIAKRPNKVQEVPLPRKKASTEHGEEGRRHRESRAEKEGEGRLKEWNVYSGRGKRQGGAAGGDAPDAKKPKSNGTRRRGEPGRLGKWAEAAKRVLELEGRPLTVREIADKALEHGFVTECGKTPQNSITSTLHTEIKKTNPVFKKIAAATFALMSMPGAAILDTPTKEEAEESGNEESDEQQPMEEDKKDGKVEEKVEEKVEGKVEEKEEPKTEKSAVPAASDPAPA